MCKTRFQSTRALYTLSALYESTLYVGAYTRWTTVSSRFMVHGRPFRISHRWTLFSVENLLLRVYDALHLMRISTKIVKVLNKITLCILYNRVVHLYTIESD